MTTPSAKTLETDAKNRFARTAIQGLVVTVLIAVLPLVQSAIANGVENTNWSALGWAALTAGGMAAASYIQRRFLDQSAVPTVLPPGETR